MSDGPLYVWWHNDVGLTRCGVVLASRGWPNNNDEERPGYLVRIEPAWRSAIAAELDRAFPRLEPGDRILPEMPWRELTLLADGRMLLRPDGLPGILTVAA